MTYQTSRIGLDGLSTDDQSIFHEIYLARAGGDGLGPAIWKANRLAPFVAAHRPAPDSTTKQLVLLVDDPYDASVMLEAKRLLGLAAEDA